MAEHRPFPPSARRLALARRAGLHPASTLVGLAIACAAALVVLAGLGRTATTQLGGWIAAACDGRATLGGPDLVGALLSLVLPLLAAVAIAVVAAHLAQTRTPWLPRRSIRDAPALDRGPAVRARGAAFELASVAVVGAVAVGWLWMFAPGLAALVTSPLAGATAIASALAACTVALVALAAVDAIARHAELAHALRMTATEKRADDRLAGADPRWTQRRREVARGREAIAEAAVLVLGDDLAIAVAWDPVRRPVPARIAQGRGPRVLALVGLARRYAIPVHHDPALARALAGAGPVPEPLWPRLATVIAAVGRR